MDTLRTSEPTLPVPNSVAALLLLVIANRRVARMQDVTDDPERFANAQTYCASLGWELQVDADGSVYVADDAQPRRGFSSGWEYLRHRVNSIDNFRAVVRQAALPRISAMTRQLSTRAASLLAPVGTVPFNARPFN